MELSIGRQIGADMVFLLWILLALVPLILGRAMLCILYGNHPAQEMTHADSLLTGWMMCIGLAEAAHLGAVFLGWSFSDCVKLFIIGVGVCLVAAGVILWIKRNKVSTKAQEHRLERERVKSLLASEGDSRGTQMVYLVFGVLVLLQVLMMMLKPNAYLDGDMTLETVNSFLTQDAIYQVNPMTGQAYTLGMPVRLKILCLPFVYAGLCKFMGLEAGQVVLNVIPAFVLLLSYAAYSTVAKELFANSKLKRGLFLVATAILFYVSDSMFGMDGFGVLHSGFRGVTIRGVVLLPYAFGLLLRRKYKLLVLCVLAEACIVWTLYGMGACVAVTVGMLGIRFVKRRVEGCRNS